MSALTLTKHNFKREVIDANQSVLIDFWAPWCMPCRMVSPIVDEIANEQGHRVKVLKVNIDDERDLAEEFGVMSIPTLMVMKQGKVVSSAVGAKSKQDLLDMLK